LAGAGEGRGSAAGGGAGAALARAGVVGIISFSPLAEMVRANLRGEGKRKRRFRAILMLKYSNIYQDRLGTAIGQALKRREWRFLFYRASGSERLTRSSCAGSGTSAQGLADTQQSRRVTHNSFFFFSFFFFRFFSFFFSFFFFRFFSFFFFFQ
jgi:hypothetical protein